MCVEAILKPPGRFLEPPGTYFSKFLHACACMQACNAIYRRMCKNYSFCKVFAGFLHVASILLTSKNNAKSFPGPIKAELPTKIVLETCLGVRRASFWRGPSLSWVALGSYLAGFWELLGGSCPLWDASWASLGHILGALGWSSALLGRILPARDAPGFDFGGFWDVLG